MGIFKDQGIIIKIEKIRDNDFLYTIFTKEYGKIRANKKFSKKEKALDLGYIINFEIITKEKISIHKIRNIKIISEFNKNKNRNFSQLNIYLNILGKIYREIPDGINNKEIFSLIENINNYENIDEIKLLLAKIKFNFITGDLSAKHPDKTIEKIFKFVSNSNIKSIFKLVGIDEKLKKELEKI